MGLFSVESSNTLFQKANNTHQESRNHLFLEIIFVDIFIKSNSVISIKRPVWNFSQKVFIKQPCLSQNLKVLLHENQGNLNHFEKVSTY